MDAFLKSTKPLKPGSHASKASTSDRKGKGRAIQKPNTLDDLKEKYGEERMKPINGGIKLANKQILSTLGQDSNLITNSTAYSTTSHVVVRSSRYRTQPPPDPPEREQSCSTGHQSGANVLPGVKTSWRLHRNAKLTIQAQKTETSVLKGVVAYLNGYMGKEITNLELIGLIQKNGGKTKMQLSAKCTHVITTTGLSGSKTERFLTRDSNSTKVVRPEWSLECIERGKRVSESKFSVVYHEGQKSVLPIMDEGTSDIRRKHVSEYESAVDVPVYSPKRRRLNGPPPEEGEENGGTIEISGSSGGLEENGKHSLMKVVKRRRKEEAEVEVLVLHTSSPPIPPEEWGKVGNDKGIEGSLLDEEDEGLEDEDDDDDDEWKEDLDEWGMPPSAQRRG